METPRHGRLKAQRYRLEGSVCPTCGQLSFPPRSFCRHRTVQRAGIVASQLLIIPPIIRMEDAISPERMIG